MKRGASVLLLAAQANLSCAAKAPVRPPVSREPAREAAPPPPLEPVTQRDVLFVLRWQPPSPSAEGWGATAARNL
jgi:hypothetical protein